jgi:hypothetical protein
VLERPDRGLRSRIDAMPDRAALHAYDRMMAVLARDGSNSEMPRRKRFATRGETIHDKAEAPHRRLWTPVDASFRIAGPCRIIRESRLAIEEPCQ